MKRFTLMKAGTLSCAIGVALSAAAQTAPGTAADEAEATELDRVTVTARKFGAGQVSAAFEVDKTEIELRPFGADITQSLSRVPGVQVSTGDARGGSFSFEMTMRGLTDEQIGLTLDGIPTGDSRFNGGSPPQRFIESSNIASLQVSQSAGEIGAPSRFALGGFVNFVSDDPEPEFGATAELGAGRFGFQRAHARLDTGQNAHGVAAYLSASRQTGDNWAGPDARSSERDHVELKAKKFFEAGSSLTARLSWNDQRDNDFNIVTLGEFLANPDTDLATDAISGIPAIDVNYGGALGGTRKDWLAYVNGDFVLTDRVRLLLNPYVQSLDGESFRYQDRSRILAGGDPRAVLGYNANGGAIRPALTTLRDSNTLGGPADMRVTPRDRDRYGATAELQLDDLIDGHRFRIGGWYEDSESGEYRNFYPLLDPATGIAFDRAAPTYVEYERHAKLDTTMLYTQDRISLLDDRLKLDLGATWYEVGYEAWSPLEYDSRLDFSQESGINGKFGAAFQLTERVELFGGYAQNFSGIPEDAFLGSTAIIDPDELKALESRNLDLGLRYVLERAAISVQAYRIDLKNGVGVVPRPSGADIDPDEIVRGNVATEAVNTAGQRNRGVELTGWFELGERFDLYASYAWQDARHDDPPAGSAERERLAAIGIVGGARVRDIPRHSLFAQLGWEPTDALRIDLTAQHIGERVGGHILYPNTFQEAGVEILDDYTVVGLGLRYAIRRPGWPQTDLALNVDNLFDEDYIGAVSGSTATQPEYGLTSATGIYTLDRYFIGAPRTWTVSVRVRF